MTKVKWEDPALLEAALEGLELQKQRIQDQIEQVRAVLGRGPVRKGRPPVKKEEKLSTKRVLSPAARKRIAAAQKKRWAEFRKNTKESQQ